MADARRRWGELRLNLRMERAQRRDFPPLISFEVCDALRKSPNSFHRASYQRKPDGETPARHPKRIRRGCPSSNNWRSAPPLTERLASTSISPVSHTSPHISRPLASEVCRGYWRFPVVIADDPAVGEKTKAVPPPAIHVHTRRARASKVLRPAPLSPFSPSPPSNRIRS